MDVALAADVVLAVRPAPGEAVAVVALVPGGAERHAGVICVGSPVVYGLRGG